jgi:DNA-binding NarL/FixJ family response regulator
MPTANVIVPGLEFSRVQGVLSRASWLQGSNVWVWESCHGLPRRPIFGSLGRCGKHNYNFWLGVKVMGAPAPIRILTVEDHPVFRAGLRTIICSEQDMLLVAQAVNGVEAIVAFRRHRPDITLMDLQLPGTNGTEIKRALRAGASAYILKSMPQDELLDVVRAVHAGKRTYVVPEIAARLAEHLGDEDLTSRELDVLRLIRDGYRNKQIADQLAIAEATVNYHIRNLVDKLGANDRTHAVTIAVRRGLLQI